MDLITNYSQLIWYVSVVALAQEQAALIMGYSQLHLSVTHQV